MGLFFFYFSFLWFLENVEGSFEFLFFFFIGENMEIKRGVKRYGLVNVICIFVKKMGVCVRSGVNE